MARQASRLCPRHYVLWQGIKSACLEGQHGSLVYSSTKRYLWNMLDIGCGWCRPRNRALDTLDEQDETAAKEAEDEAFSSWDLPEDEKVEAPAPAEAPARAEAPADVGSAAATEEAAPAPARPALRLAARPKVAPRPATQQERQDQALTDAARQGPPPGSAPGKEPAY